MADNKMKVSSANRDTKPVVQKSVELTGSALIDIRRGAWMLRNTENLNLPNPTSQYYCAYLEILDELEGRLKESLQYCKSIRQRLAVNMN